MENSTTFKIKRGYYLQRLKPDRMKLLGSNETWATKVENGENVPQLEITEVILAY